jgi:hypothetical protein
MIERPLQPLPTVDDVRTIERKGPWDTKSGGQLSVLMSIPLGTIESGYFRYESSELQHISQDVRGLRVYTVHSLQRGQIGANEWHRIRNELVFAMHGIVKWNCEDAYGAKREFILDEKTGVWTPPFILHTYETIQGVGELLVVANTLFMPDDPSTHDTYPSEAFQELQEQLKTSAQI